MKPHTVLLALIVVACLASARADQPQGPPHDHWDLVIGAVVSIAVAYLGDRRVHRRRNETALSRLRVGLKEIEGSPHGPAKNPYPKV